MLGGDEVFESGCLARFRYENQRQADRLSTQHINPHYGQTRDSMQNSESFMLDSSCEEVSHQFLLYGTNRR